MARSKKRKAATEKTMKLNKPKEKKVLSEKEQKKVTGGNRNWAT